MVQGPPDHLVLLCRNCAAGVSLLAQFPFPAARSPQISSTTSMTSHLSRFKSPAAFQHLFVMSSGWIYVVMVVNAIGGTSTEMQSLIRMSMIASGIATIVQAKRGFGNGYLCPLTCSLSYLAPLTLAGRMGGYSEWYCSRASPAWSSRRGVYRLRFLFPPEVTGLIVAMSGLQIVALGCPPFLGYSRATATVDSRFALLVGVITLFAMIVPTIWNRGKLHLFPMLIGIAASYVSALALNQFRTSQLLSQMAAAYISLPNRAAWELSFNWLLATPFLIAGLTATLKTVGDTTLCQKVNDADWKRTDMKSVSGGVFANGLGTAVSGLLGGIA